MTQLYRPTMTPDEESLWRRLQTYGVVALSPEQRIRAIVAEHQNWNISRIAKELGVTHQAVSQVVQRYAIPVFRGVERKLRPPCDVCAGKNSHTGPRGDIKNAAESKCNAASAGAWCGYAVPQHKISLAI